MNFEQARALMRQMEEARNKAITRYEIFIRDKPHAINLHRMWPNDWPHDCRVTTTDGVEYLVGFKINQTTHTGEVFSSYEDVDCRDDWLKRYAELYPDEWRYEWK